jgi:hypothetical protein
MQKANVVAESDLLAQRGGTLSDCDRGAMLRFGPGQLVGYPPSISAISCGKRAPQDTGRHEYVWRLVSLIRRALISGPAECVRGLTGA